MQLNHERFAPSASVAASSSASERIRNCSACGDRSSSFYAFTEGAEDRWRDRRCRRGEETSPTEGQQHLVEFECILHPTLSLATTCLLFSEALEGGGIAIAAGMGAWLRCIANNRKIAHWKTMNDDACLTSASQQSALLCCLMPVLTAVKPQRPRAGHICRLKAEGVPDISPGPGRWDESDVPHKESSSSAFLLAARHTLRSLVSSSTSFSIPT